MTSGLDATSKGDIWSSSGPFDFVLVEARAVTVEMPLVLLLTWC